MKKILKATLSVILIFAILIPVSVNLNAEEAEEENLPTVYVVGQGVWLENAEGEVIYPSSAEINKEFILDAAKSITPAFLKGYITGNYDQYCKELCEIIDPLFASVRLDKNGERKPGESYRPRRTLDSIRENFENSEYKRTGKYGLFDFEFDYDWRIDPFETADELAEYIDIVLDLTGAEKVNLIGRCLGVNETMVYLQKYGTSKINKYLMYCGVLWGTELCSSLFSGTVKIDATAVDNFLYAMLGEDLLMEIIKDSVTILNRTHGLKLAANFINKVYNDVKDELSPELVMRIYGTMPSYWSMLSEEDYETAKKLVFSNGREKEYAGLIEKIDNYHNKVRLKSKEILKAAEADGVAIGSICKYGYQIIPAVKEPGISSDVFVSLWSSSLGATTNGFNKPLKNSYIRRAKRNGTDKYISPDKQVDASTCLFPESTWIIKNIEHADFPEVINREIMIPFLRFKGQMTVNDRETAPRFLVYGQEDSSLSPMTKENSKTEKVNSGSLFVLLGRVIVNSVKLIINNAKNK
ncbi:MAG: hypothetical protein K5756_09225 [Clostridiales bacterium]|nr:hypothetical protein [Clostridiales bacterium]